MLNFLDILNLHIFSSASGSELQLKTSAKNSTVLKKRGKQNLISNFELSLSSFRVKVMKIVGLVAVKLVPNLSLMHTLIISSTKAIETPDCFNILRLFHFFAVFFDICK